MASPHQHLQAAIEAWPLAWRVAPSHGGLVTLVAHAGPLLRLVRVDVDDDRVDVHFLWFTEFNADRKNGDVGAAITEARAKAEAAARQQVGLFNATPAQLGGSR